MNKYIFLLLVITKLNTFACYVRRAKIFSGNIMRKDKDKIRSENGGPFKSPEATRTVRVVRGCYGGRRKGELFYLRAPLYGSFGNSLDNPLWKGPPSECSASSAPPPCARLEHGGNKTQLFAKTQKYVENLRKVKKIDNTILGNDFHGKENEIIHEIPDRFLNAFKWALQFRLKNFNCKFMRLSKLAKKNNEELKNYEDYAIGYKENLLAMLQKDKNFFLDIVNKLKAKDYFNFDIYSIFRFINIDVRFFFFPECHDQSAVFFLIFGNLEKAIDYFIRNKDTVDFMEMEKYKKMGDSSEVRLSIRQRKRLRKAERKREREERQRAYMARGGASSLGDTDGGVTTADEGIANGENADKETVNEESADEESTDDETVNEESADEESTDDEMTNDESAEDKIFDEGATPDISINSISEAAPLEDKFDYFLKHYDDVEFFFMKHFKTPEELKCFFEKCHEEEHKIEKEEINFNAKGEEIITKNQVLKKGLNLEMIKKIIKTSPRLSLVNKNTILKRIAHYKNELKYGHDELVHILYNLPQFYAFGNLKKKYKELLYLHESIEEEDLNTLIKKYPRIFTYNVYRTIRPKLLYLIRHMNKTFRDTLSFPQYFSYSFRLRIIPRHVAYMNIYYDNYISYYKELLRTHNYDDFNRKFNELVYKPDIPPINLKMLLQTSNKDFMKHYKISYYDFVKSTQVAKDIHNPFILV
ncbi:conserved Plasmodium protein, unknown function [Plasmodium knowlesi strain H]|uniref:mTERF domain-containing protein n=3 Tax=Plasmodium knowlesi TaxID=5850 RepID=A0A5K1TXP9_PLAKH|nr:uncharacterized protein PKNH_0212100 [Plasmodium knowlesi strain H]OTN66343.1 Uncharacterized protein PKNOH_S09521900 [Plasmodium knowlesi]CAA9986387.1 mTERF domain-containing protein, putative [Plasmodium knowlesi strain H]SBO25655.1 conserved Plasmodium protein, unknown function [Plasmodium knowlesi strain H]SBO28372.1 conserved Plasmodium protein, unknown function [Plasmodium knowlesi strain H]VVS75861.1 mTERF domain-containing protein, putative [Plasmodium knowlesi strain H]|eukprot:XP_002257793.1 [Plasmodium knowlesi strain H]